MVHRIMLLIALLIQTGCATPAVSNIASTPKNEDIPVANVDVFVEPLPGPLQATR